MSEVDLKIGGRSYLVACQAGEELHLKSAAATLNKEADHVVQASGGRLPESRVLLMAGLMLADRIAEGSETERYAEERIEALEQKLRDAEKANAALTKQIAETPAESSTGVPAPIPAEAGTSDGAALQLLEKIARELEETADQIEGRSAA